MQKIQTGEYLQREPAILILEAIDPPNLLDIACETANGFGTTEKIAARIIQNKAKTTDINRLLDIITKANFTIPVNAACDTITKICPTNAQNIFFEYLETNQNIQDWKRRIIIGYIAESDVKRYNQNPLQVFDDFKPNEIELLEFLKGILKNKHYTEETKQQIIQTITEELEENLPPHYDPITVRQILEQCMLEQHFSE
ncbi:MAG: hypothetical protein KatS3mg087_1520 [Patescibacteria group bacterium]|nr:MAG: hypothetical protein KatS3mg087_1520 [Patescibacteria group bacterium]